MTGLGRLAKSMALAALGPVVLCTSVAHAGAVAVADPLQEFSRSIETLVKQVSPSVVQVLVTGYGPVRDENGGDAQLVIGKQQSLGSGVVIDAAGYIMTNAHVVKGARRIQVVLSAGQSDAGPISSLNRAKGRTVEARVVGVAPEVDLALLQVDAGPLSAISVADYGALRQGELIFAFGSPEGLHNSVTMGVVSSVARQPDEDRPMVYIQTDAPINHGNSGGPLVDVTGALVGINTFIMTESGGSQGLGFAIPSSVVNMAYRQLRKYGHLHQGEIGAALQTVTPTLARGLRLARESGVIVSDVSPEGPADVAGLRANDVIVAVDGRPMDSLPSIAFYLYARSAGDHLKTDIVRGDQPLVLDIPVRERSHDLDGLGDRVDPEAGLVRQLGVLGVTIDDDVEPLLSGVRVPSGVIVAARAELASASDVSLSVGDIIHAVNGTVVLSVAQLRAGLDGLAPHSAVVLQVERGGIFSFVPFELD
jgi:serine protease Do